MPQDQLITVVIPTFNRKNELERALTSLCDQTVKDFRVIVSDDGSTDGTEDLVYSFRDRLNIVYIWRPNWGGPARPRNIAIEAVETDWVAFLDSDDSWLPEKIEVVKKYLTECNDLIYHNMVVAGSVRKSKINVRRLQKPIFRDLLIKGNTIPNSSVVVRKSLLEEVGPLLEDKALAAVEDFDLWLRCAKVTDKFLCIKQPLGLYWISNDNISGNRIQQTKKVRMLYERYVEEMPESLRRKAMCTILYRECSHAFEEGYFSQLTNYFYIVFASRNWKLMAKALARIFFPHLWKLKKRWFEA